MNSYKIGKSGLLIPEDALKLVSSEGCEVNVYRYQDLVFKIYKVEANRSHLSEKELLYLSKIPTKRILVPKKEALYNEFDDYAGYIMDYIGEERCFFDASLQEVSNDLLLMKEDTSLFTSASVRMGNLGVNGIYTNHLYMVDPGNFRKVTMTDSDDLIRLDSHNLEELDNLIRYAIFKKYLTMVQRKECYRELLLYFFKMKARENYYSLADVLKEEAACYPDISLFQYMRRLTKRF